MRSATSGPCRVAWDKSRLGVDMLAAVERGLARDPKSLPRIERDRRNNGGGNGATVELLKVLLKQIADAQGVAPKLIANVDDLEAIANGDQHDVPALQGWRRELFGAKAIDLKNGKLALTVENGKVVALEWQGRGATGRLKQRTGRGAQPRSTDRYPPILTSASRPISLASWRSRATQRSLARSARSCGKVRTSFDLLAFSDVRGKTPPMAADTR